jgi:tetratricopeptide (TPR) repeat protein
MYLKALDQWSRPSSESLGRVKELLDQAVAIDPEFAAAHCLLGLYYTMFASLGMKPTREVIPLARAAVDEALRIDPCLPEAHALRGVWAGGYDNYDWREAEQHWRVAMSGELASCHVHFWYGHHFLLPLGRFDDALAQMTKGLEGDPINLLYRHHRAVGLRNVGRLDEAEAEKANPGDHLATCRAFLEGEHPPKLGSNVGPKPPKHRVKRRSGRYQKAGRVNHICFLA